MRRPRIEAGNTVRHGRFAGVAAALCCGAWMVAAAPALLPQTPAPSGARSAWRPDNGDGTYRNPVLFADYSDPDVVRAGDDFYMVSSSFHAVPAIPVLHSRDLVNWSLIGTSRQRSRRRATTRPSTGMACGRRVFATTRAASGCYFGDPILGIFMTTAATRGARGSR